MRCRFVRSSKPVQKDPPEIAEMKNRIQIKESKNAASCRAGQPRVEKLWQGAVR